MRTWQCIFVFAACHAPPPVVVPAPELTFLGHALAPGMCETIADMHFSLTNTRAVPLTLSHWTVRSNRDDTLSQEAATSLDEVVQPGEEKKLSLPAHVARKCDALETTKTAATVGVTLQGKIFGDAGGPVVFEFEDKFDMPAARLPVLKIEATAQHYDDNRVEVIFTLHMTNDNAFALTVSKVAYQLRIDGVDAASGETWNDEALGTDALDSFELPVRIEPSDTSALAKVVRKRDFRYTLDATMTLDARDYPLHLMGDVRF